MYYFVVAVHGMVIPITESVHKVQHQRTCVLDIPVVVVLPAVVYISLPHQHGVHLLFPLPFI
jgi:hypothetical protein